MAAKQTYSCPECLPYDKKSRYALLFVFYAPYVFFCFAVALQYQNT